ncbi:MAG TPA: NAD-binding protein, partial [Planctomycetota bacterium]|nr:NAD-binding protein [Planctomycetota bacterium]
VLEGAGAALPAGELHMLCDAGGYVGLTAAEHGRLVVAAALDAATVVQAGGLGPAAAAIVARAGLPAIAGLADAHWLGTPPLTRRAATLAARRAFVLGDAAGFVEPFTGEGLAWALTAARAVQPFALAAVERWDEALAAGWRAEWSAVVARRQRLCRGLAAVLRRPLAVRAAVAALALRPQLVAPILQRLDAVAGAGAP